MVLHQNLVGLSPIQARIIKRVFLAGFNVFWTHGVFANVQYIRERKISSTYFGYAVHKPEVQGG